MIKDSISFPDFVKLDIRIGKIKTAENVEGSERLIKMKIDLGKEVGTRQIIAGVALHYQVDQLVGKKVAVLVNLESKKMMGMESSGMILAAGDEQIAFLMPDKDVPAGSIVR